MRKFNTFSNDKITLTDSYYINATEKVMKNVLSLDADRFLAGFRENAACAKKEEYDFSNGKKRYGGWENTLIGGHTFGHYLTALAQGYVNPNINEIEKQIIKDRLNYIIPELKKCQKMTEGTKFEGYIFSATLPDENFRNCIDLQFNNVEKRQGDIFKQAWVPWYTMHKILQGLIDVALFTKDRIAMEIAENLGFWIARRVNAWDETTKNNVLSIEYGGMNDVLYQLYAASKSPSREEFLKAAHQFDEIPLFEKVLKDTPDALDNIHANTTIPKFIGALRRYEVTGEKLYLDYAEAFWKMVIEKHTYITGGNSENEHFGRDYMLAAERTHVNNETCNTHNMLKFSRSLFEITGDIKYADYYENTYLNAIMSSLNPETGCTMYFQPMATGYQKVFTSVDQHFWCCTGTGWENFTKLQDSIYYHDDKSVIVNQLVPSILDTGSAFTKVECNFLKSEKVRFMVKAKPGYEIDFDFIIRIPEWCSNPVIPVFYEKEQSERYVKISCSQLKFSGDFEITLPMEMKIFGLKDDSETYAFKYGPYVLSAGLGTENQETGSHGMWVTVPAKKAVENDELKLNDGLNLENFLEHAGKYFEKSEDNNVPHWKLSACDRTLDFIPHYLQYRESYGVYWKILK